MDRSVLTRREFWMTGGAGIVLAGAVSKAAAVEPAATPRFEFLYHIEADLEPPQMIGSTGKGNRMVFIVTGGTVEGPNIKGAVLPGGGDWFMMRDDGVAELDVRIAIKTDDNALIYSHYTGLTHEQTGDGSRYFVIAPTFETSSEKYADLTRIVAVGIGSVPGPNRVAYDCFAIRH